MAELIIPVVLPKNGEKTTDDLKKFLLSLVPEQNKEAFSAVYFPKIDELPLELEGPLSVKGGWGAFVIDFMVNACRLRDFKQFNNISKTKLSKVCVLSFLGYLDMYEPNNGRSRNFKQFFKFKDDKEHALFGCDRAIAICCKYGIQLDDADIECINYYKNLEKGEKMTLIFASQLPRLMYAAYQLTRVDFMNGTPTSV